MIVSVVVLTTLLSLVLYQTITKVRAEDRSWTQTDWRGGSAPGVITQNDTTFNDQENMDYSNEGYLTMLEEQEWQKSSWLYRKKISFDNTSSNLGVEPEVLTDFPVLIKLEDGVNIDYSKTNNDGSDIRFVDTDGTELSYEIEQWGETGDSFVWVKIPQIDIGDEDYIYMYYGNTSASDGQNATNVWDDGFLGVWHLNESVGNLGVLRNSTGTNDGIWEDSDSSGNTGQLGLIGRSARFNLNDKVSTSITNQLGDFTVEVWFKDDGVTTTHERLADKSYTACFWLGRNASTVNSWGGGIQQPASPYGIYVNLADGQWNQIASIRDGNQHYLYGNGSSQMTSMTVPTTLCDSTNFGIGAWGAAASTQQRLGGNIDEVRLSSIPRSRSWISASYKSGRNEFNVYDNEVSKLPSSSNLVSNVFDTGYPSDWGELIYTKSGNGYVEVRVRTDINEDMNSALDWSICNPIDNGNLISLNNCVEDGERYVQYQIVFEPDGANSPVFEFISISFSASDQTAPTQNATGVILANSVANDQWINFKPTINWTAGIDNDGGNGVEGYCISLDEVNPNDPSQTLDPISSSGILTGIDDGVGNSACPYIVSNTSINLSEIEDLVLTSNKKYYFSIKAVDYAGNVWDGLAGNYQDLVFFRYDATVPQNVMYISTPSSNFGNINEMFFSWPITGSSQALDNESGILGWQYSINSSSAGAWKGSTLSQELGVEYISISESEGVYYLDILKDGDDVIVGNNTIYFRSIDISGNVSTYATGGINYGGQAPTFPAESAVTISPEESESNEFSLSWPEAIPGEGREIESYYYMINTQPPTNISTLKNNSSVYIPLSDTTVSAGILTGAVKGSNTVYVVAVDDQDNYSPSNKISGVFELNSENPDPPQNLSVSDTSVKGNELWRVAITWEEPEYKGNGEVSYVVEKSIDGSLWFELDTIQGLAYSDVSLVSRRYYYRVGSIDTSDESRNNPSYTISESIIPVGRYEEPPELVSDVIVTNITSRNAQVNWITDRLSDSKIQIGINTNEYFDDEIYRSEKVINHELQLTNLNPGTAYYYRTKWTDEDGNTGMSRELTLITKPAPRVEDVKISTVGLDYAILDVTTVGAINADVLYGKTKSYGGSKKINTSTVESEYSIMLTELEDGTQYHYTIILTDEQGYEYDGFGDLVFNTPPRPQVSNVQIQEKKGVATPTIEVFWESNIAVNSIVKYSTNAKSMDKVDMELIEGEHIMEIEGLDADSEYQLTVEGVDAMGNRAVSDVYAFTTATDTRSPVISSIKSEGDIQSSDIQSDRSRSAQLIISWKTDEPSTSQVLYGEGATNDGFPYSTQTDSQMRYEHVMIVSNLSPSKVYHFKVVSKDSAGNVGESGSVTSITPKSTDTVMESVLGSLGRIFNFF